jgi:betaine reductase
MTAVHYVNQFFAGLGGEAAAGSAPVRIEGTVGPGRALAADGVQIDVTLACGSGRYGYACGVLAREAGRRGVPVVTAMTPDSPGVIAAEGSAYVVPTGSTVSSMKDALPRLASLAKRLAAREAIGEPDAEGYLPRRERRNVRAGRPGAERAIDLLLVKLEGDVRTEVAPSGDRVTPPPAIDVASATIALVTEAGCVPRGNPDRLSTRHANRWLGYALDGADSMSAERYGTVHAGFDTTSANADPNRLVPLDAARELESDGRIGRLHDAFYTTTGVDTPVATAVTFGREIAAELKSADVSAVILTGT